MIEKTLHFTFNSISKSLAECINDSLNCLKEKNSIKSMFYAFSKPTCNKQDNTVIQVKPLNKPLKAVLNLSGVQFRKRSDLAQYLFLE